MMIDDFVCIDAINYLLNSLVKIDGILNLESIPYIMEQPAAAESPRVLHVIHFFMKPQDATTSELYLLDDIVVFR